MRTQFHNWCEGRREQHLMPPIRFLTQSLGEGHFNRKAYSPHKSQPAQPLCSIPRPKEGGGFVCPDLVNPTEHRVYLFIFNTYLFHIYQRKCITQLWQLLVYLSEEIYQTVIIFKAENNQNLIENIMLIDHPTEVKSCFHVMRKILLQAIKQLRNILKAFQKCN